MNATPNTGPRRGGAERSRGERAVQVVGYWTPELLGAALAAAGAVWVWPGCWALVALLLARIPARPLLQRWRAHRATTQTGAARGPGARLLTDDNPTARDDWEASA